MNLRRYVATSDRFPAVVARKLYRLLQNFSVPAPRILVVPALRIFLLIRSVYYFVWRIFVCEPLFKAYCTRYGRNLHTGVYIHWVEGKGQIIVGDNVTFDGKCGFSFASRYAEMPQLVVGDNTGIGHGAAFTVAKAIIIGNNCRIATEVHMLDSPGHPSDPSSRLFGMPAADEDVRPIAIGNNVWIGHRATVFPGVSIGDGSVVAMGAVVMSNVPPNTLVAGNPARQVRSLQRSEEIRDGR